MNRALRRASRAESAAPVATFPARLTPMPRSEWPAWTGNTEPPREVWVSRRFTVQVFAAPGEALARISVQRTDRADGITWEELQTVKRDIGRGSLWAVEVYPAEGAVVNDANMRHLWLLPGAPGFAWQRGAR